MTTKRFFAPFTALLAVGTVVCTMYSCRENGIEDYNNADDNLLVKVATNDVQNDETMRQAQADEQNRPASALQLPQGIGVEDLQTHPIYFDNEAGMNAFLVETGAMGVNPTKTAAATRGKRTKAIEQNFTLSAMRANKSAGLNIPFNWMDNVTFAANGLPLAKHFWAKKEPYAQFFAVVPMATAANGMGKMVHADNKTTINFTVNPDVRKQVDLLAGVSPVVYYDGGGNAPNVALPFRHALTAVNFRVGNIEVKKAKIKSVRFKKVYSRGTFVFGTHNTPGTWKGHADERDFALENLDIPVDMAGDYVVGNDKDNFTFMFIPQKLDNRVEVEVAFNNGAVLKAKLKGEWKPGMTKTYILDDKTGDWAYVFNMSTINGETFVDQFDQDQQFSFTVQSFRSTISSIKDFKQQPVQWDIVGYQTEVGEGNWGTLQKGLPSWIRFDRLGGPGGITQDVCTGVAVHVSEMNIDDLLAQRNKGLAKEQHAPSGYCLANDDGVYNKATMTTANTYVVSKAGTYSIPLVVGTSFVKGKEIKHAYDVLPGYNDQLMTTPYLRKQIGKKGSLSARVLWSDPEGAISSVNLNDDLLFFTVDKNKVKTGNAVIAVQDQKNKIVWSWQIWFTDENVSLKTMNLTNKWGKSFKYMQEPLGWTYTKWKRIKGLHKPERVRLKLRQTGSGKTLHIIVKRNHELWDGYTALYQYGRKDPFLSTASKRGLFAFKALENGDYGLLIKNPTTFALGPITYKARYYHSLSDREGTYWDGNSGSPYFGRSEKMSFDPSPRGFKVPPSSPYFNGPKGTLKYHVLVESRAGIIIQPENGNDCMLIPYHYVLNESGQLCEEPGKAPGGERKYNAFWTSSYYKKVEKSFETVWFNHEAHSLKASNLLPEGYSIRSIVDFYDYSK